MAAKAKLLDIWLVDGNVVYKEVPFTVAIDWVQQGRVLAEDKVRQAGTETWFLLASSKTLAAYLPRAEPFHAEDQAEALEPVAIDFTWKRPVDDDDDVDMIPLIDISLVLLVFFMMTSTVIIAATSIDVPGTRNAFIGSTAVWIGIDRGNEGQPLFSFGEGEKPAAAENLNLSEAEVVNRLGRLLQERNDKVEVRIAADRRLPAEVVMNMTAALEPLRQSGHVRAIRAEVNEKK